MKEDTHVKEAYNYLKYKKIVANMQELADKIGAQRTSVSAALNGNELYLTPSFCKRFNQAFDEIFDENWLLTGEGSMLKETSNEDNNASFVAPYIKDELIYLPLFSVPALASFMDNTSQATGVIETYPVYVAKGEAYTKDKHIVIEVKGESMYPTINNKAMILCEKVGPEQWDNVQSEQIIAIVYDNSFTIKRVLRNNLATTNTLTLSADNPKYGTLEVARCDIKGIYKAIKKVSEYL